MTRITCISDLHGFFPKLDGGDLLIVAGDLTAFDTEIEYLKFYEWLSYQEYKKIIFIAGNHDNWLEKNRSAFDLGKIEYLCDSGIEFEGLKIWGMPWSLTFEGISPRCTAFTCTEDEMRDKCDMIPDDTDILISHGPPFGILDGIPASIPDGSKWFCGSHNLYNRLHEIINIGRHRMKAVIFGHIHEHGGKKRWEPYFGCDFINASIVDERYRHIHKPVEIEI